ncbi:hypothetical protein EDB89DRAFT_1901132 [Lactarius sanguifluus]|nr:hypothetical protein EDB89DRAFT_1901132 [Lactarius sanguifluus]
MPMKKAKQDAKSSEESDWPDDESEDEDYDSDLESNGSCTSFDFGSIAPDRIERRWQQDIEFDREIVETELDKMAIEMSGSPSGSSRYLGFYQKAIKLVEEGLDEETRVKYRAEAKTWAEKQCLLGSSSDHVPPIWSSAIYLQSNDLPNSYDNNDELGGTSFKARYKGWSQDPMVEEFSRWTAASFGAHPADSEEENINKGATPKVKLLMDENSWEAIDRGGLMYKKMVIGKFMSKMYDANAILKHWIQRQAAGKVPFRFKKVQKADRHHGDHPPQSANGQQPREELLTQEDGGILPTHPPNPPPPLPCARPPPHIITQCHPPTGSPRVGPPHENPPNNQATADTCLSKCQKVDAHETRRSACTSQLTEWAKQNQSSGTPARTKARH